MKSLTTKLVSNLFCYVALPCFLIGCVPEKEIAPISVNKIPFSQTIEVGRVTYNLDEFILFSYPKRSEVRAIISSKDAMKNRLLACLEASFVINEEIINREPDERNSHQESPSLKSNELGLVWKFDRKFEGTEISISSVEFCG